MTGTDRSRVVVVTGGASGIGRAAVDRFLDAGWRVVAADVNEAAGREVVAAAAAKDHADAIAFVPADVASERDVAGLVAATVERFGHIDAFVNNAAVTGAVGSILDIDEADWDFTVAVVLRSVFLGIKHAGRTLVAQGRGGAIVNTASVAGLVGGAGPTPYATAKAGVINLTRYAAAELAPNRIRVNAVCPGSILTPMAHRGDAAAAAAAAERMRTRQPWPEHGRPEDVAEVIHFLASESSAFVTGEAVVVDGGLVAAGVKVMPPPAAGGAVVVNMGTTGRPDVTREARPQ